MSNHFCLGLLRFARNGEKIVGWVELAKPNISIKILVRLYFTMRYRRAKNKGGTYFFTVVTFQRKKILSTQKNVEILREAFQKVKARHLFAIEASVVLPDHLHCIWRLPPDDYDFSTRWRLLKTDFTRNCENRYKSPPGASRKAKGEQGVWQRRFWEHLIRDENDMARHVEYIHYNPVKHGLAKTPRDWPYSSFHQYVRRGAYRENWGADEPVDIGETIGNE